VLSTNVSGIENANIRVNIDLVSGSFIQVLQIPDQNLTPGPIG
jgi:hypothetical protein